MSPVISRYWRVPVVALLGGLIAFGGSFLSSEKYSSTTRLLIRGREATFLTTTGSDLSQQPGVIDSSLAKSLAETQAGIVTSREVATIVVDKLHLDQPKPSGGLLTTVAHGAGTAYKCVKAFVSHGFCQDPEPREGAIQAVQAGVSANQLGATAGESSGQPNSYVLELVGTGEDPKQARAVAEVAADAVVGVSARRFAAESRRHADNLEAQARAAGETLVKANQAETDFRITRNITEAERRAVDDLATATTSANRANDIAVELAGARSEQETLAASTRAAAPTQLSSQDIVTGRSSNRVTTNSPNPVHNDLLIASEKLKARIADLEAQAAAIAARPPGVADTRLTQDQTDMLRLKRDVTLAEDNQAVIDKQYRAALVDASRASSELTRIDTASLPTYPDEPRRVLYLALGLLFGAIAGGYLTWRREALTYGPGYDDRESFETGNGRQSVVDLTAQNLETAPSNGGSPVHSGAG